MWRSEHLVARYRASVSPTPTCTLISWRGGTAAFGAYLNSLAERDIRFGTMIAGNSGRIAGACGDTIEMRFRSIHPNHTTQEENIVSNWVTTMEKLGYAREQLFAQLLDHGRPRWGLVKPLDNVDRTTYQKKDYTVAKPRDYYEAWAVQGAILSGDSMGGGGLYATSLVFVAGPNVGSRGTANGSMARTFNHVLTEYKDFREAVKQAVRAGLVEMDKLGCQVALVAGVSTGIYAGPHRSDINVEFVDIVNEILREMSVVFLKLVYYVTLPNDKTPGPDPATLKRLLAEVQTLHQGSASTGASASTASDGGVEQGQGRERKRNAEQSAAPAEKRSARAAAAAQSPTSVPGGSSTAAATLDRALNGS